MAMKTGRDTKHSGAIEIILIIIIIVTIVLIGWYIHHVSQSANGTYNQAIHTNSSSPPKFSSKQKTPTKTYIDSSETFMVTYPSAWGVGAVPMQSGTPFPLVNSDLVSLTPPNAPSTLTGAKRPNALTIIVFQTGNTLGVLKKSSFGNEQTAPKRLTINGYTAYYQQDTATRNASQAPTFTDDQYAVTHNGVTLLVSFRERQGVDKNSHSVGFNASATVPTVIKIVNSIKFRN